MQADGDEGNARPAQPGPSWRERRAPPRHAPVWVRIDGTWCRGRVTAWVSFPGSRIGWQCQIEAEPDGTGRP
jgi:hypothetical protein